MQFGCNYCYGMQFACSHINIKALMKGNQVRNDHKKIYIVLKKLEVTTTISAACNFSRVSSWLNVLKYSIHGRKFFDVQ